MSSSLDSEAEWLEPDGLGGFALGTVGGIRTRRYHDLFLARVEKTNEAFSITASCRAPPVRAAAP